MEMEREHQLSLPRQQVWEALNDPGTLQACIPGCESVEQVADNEFDTAVTSKVGPVKARFKGRVRLEDLDPPSAYTLSFEGNGGQAGFAKGSARVRLEDAGDASTRLSYSVQAQVGGKLAQVGSRVVEGAARKTADDFFNNLISHLGGEREAGERAEEPASAAAAAPGSSQLWPWAVAAAVLVLVIALLAL